MKIKSKNSIVFGLILLSTIAVAQQIKKTADFKIITTQNQYEVGSDIVLKFSTSQAEKSLLYCSNSYGSTLVYPTMGAGILQYVIPENMSKKIGVLNWKLLQDNLSLSGKFDITPKHEVATMETYIGPPSIQAGGTDYTMLVVIPTDSLDNPVATNTLVQVNHQFLTSIERDDILTENLIAYKNIYSKQEKGRMLISSESLGINSKEFTANVTAAIPTNFSIYAIRPHEYADGNQITTFSTSIIKDRFNNVVSDGTFVTFFITNTKGNILKSSGTTINGIAKSKIIHPDFEENWSIKAYVEGISESNMFNLRYKKVIEDFNVVFSKNNRDITIGPLQSFMKQMIPDGLQVRLQIYQGDSLIETFSKTSYNGFVNFNLKPSIFKNENYNFSIQTAGIGKEFKDLKLW